MKRVFGTVEAIFDILYLVIATMVGFLLLFSSQGNISRMLAGIMALVLSGGDAFHLIPRVQVIIMHEEEKLRKVLGRGKQITSITMTVYYVLLWQIGLLIFMPKEIYIYSYLLYVLAAVRVVLCLLPQNKWQDRYPPVTWGMIRNIPFFLQGFLVAILFYIHRETAQGFGLAWAWLAIFFSFMFYLPVVLFANRKPKIGMLMLPKTCAYLWLLVMCLSL